MKDEQFKKLRNHISLNYELFRGCKITVEQYDLIWKDFISVFRTAALEDRAAKKTASQ